MSQKKFHVAVAGATGAVGRQMITCLEERDFPLASIRYLASSRSAGKKLAYKDQGVVVEELTNDSFGGVDIALFSAGGVTSEQFAPIAAESGAIVIDNSSAWRMDPEVPLVVPEVNPDAVSGYQKKGIIANPNCSTIQMVVALHPIHQAFDIKRVVVSTYQAVSGTGMDAIKELANQTAQVLAEKKTQAEVYPHTIAFNCLPHIDRFFDNGYTKEELKMVNETRKIMGDNTIGVTATTVRVPVFFSHSEAVNVETRRPISAGAVRELLMQAPGVKVVDDPAKNQYPMALDAAGSDWTFVGRIRDDESIENGVNLWIVADNIRKGAATNSVQIAELLTQKHF